MHQRWVSIVAAISSYYQLTALTTAPNRIYPSWTSPTRTSQLILPRLTACV